MKGSKNASPWSTNAELEIRCLEQSAEVPTEHLQQYTSHSKAVMDHHQEAPVKKGTECRELWKNVKGVMKATTERRCQEGLYLSTPMTNRVDRVES